MKLRRLRRLKLNRVDLVEAGANPGAHIQLYKHATKTENGADYPATDFAYVPDQEKSSTWKLRLTKTPGESPDAGTLKELIQKGFGEIPEKDLSAVKTKVLGVWLKANPNKKRDDAPGVLKMAEEETTETTEEEETPESTEESTEETTETETPTEEPSADVEKILKAQRKELDETKSELKLLRKVQRDAEFVAKAKEYSSLGSTKDIGKLLDEADEHFSKETKELLEKLLKSATKQVDEGLLFKRISEDVDGESKDWEDKLAQAARDRVAKGDAKTVEQAKVAIMREDPELRKEREASIRG